MSRRIVKYIILGLVSVFVLHIVFLIIDINLFGYKKSDNSLYLKTFNLFEDSIATQIRVEQLYTNSQGDSICLAKLSGKYQIVSVHINQFLSSKPLVVEDKRFVDLKSPQLTHLETISLLENPLVEINSKVHLPNENQLFLTFGKSHEVLFRKKNKNYCYFDLKTDVIQFSSDKEYFDFSIYTHHSRNTNLFIHSDENKFYIFILYSLEGIKLESSELLELIRPEYK